MATEGPFRNASNATAPAPTEHLSSSVLSTAASRIQSSTTNITEIIAANDVASRANYCYMFCAVLGFASGLFLFYSFIKSYRARRNWTWLDSLLCALSVSEFIILLCSLSSLAHRPDLLRTTNLNCTLLSFLFNAAFFSGQLLLVLMGFFLTFDQDPPSRPLLQKARDAPAVCVALTTVLSLLSAAVLAGLLGARQSLNQTSDCRLDPRLDGGGYKATKLLLGFILPNLLLLALLAAGCVIWGKSSGGFLSRLKAFPVFLAVALVTFICRFFYSSVLMKRVGRPPRPSQEALMSVAEFVLFSGSCGSLVLVLLLHGPCRESLQNAARRLGECCRSVGGRDTNRHIMAPRIEITDTQENYD
ncbi:hypothetical protein COCON_G00030090 [Conger conger]|uniref:Transmembrane protein n=1 Tax=Conger conger TaxID=82655 RepID=A0A9Q1I683_CONCO|nr:uncharacterized protein LOC133122683 [Conger conger]KAJ8284159.1 hypothetical protein COCON_G00030090 [Conger conger]